MKTTDELSRSPRERRERFYQLSRQERDARLIEMGVLTPEDIKVLHQDGALDFSLANQFIENAIGCFPLPLGLAFNFVIDEREYLIPMAVEETSVIVAANQAAKWIRDHQGEITTQNLGQLGLGQIQFPKVNDIQSVKQLIALHKDSLIQMTNREIAASLFERGGGVRDIVVREIVRPDGQSMAVIHLLVDTCDAMGANTINQICEFLKGPLEAILDEKANLCILSNLVDGKIVQAKVVVKKIDLEMGHAIAEASLFAQLDPYRAATNNKGAFNGMDAVLIATGNDWRAVEAGAHAYAARSGQYTSITKWTMQNDQLHGVIEIPMSVGIVGGVTRLHPLAQISLKMLKVKSAAELARVIAAVGLVQNLAALKALSTQGIVKGHMKLHISNLAVAAGATEEELPFVKQQLIEKLKKDKRVTETDARTVLANLRNKLAP